MTDDTKPKAKAKPKSKQKVYFTEKELKCKHTGEYKFDDDFLALLTKIRIECGFAFPITSGYRSEKHPIEARKIYNGGKAGAHSTGKAVDIQCAGEEAMKIIEVAIKHGIKRIGVAQKGNMRFIHIDSCTEEDGFPAAIWSY